MAEPPSDGRFSSKLEWSRLDGVASRLGVSIYRGALDWRQSFDDNRICLLAVQAAEFLKPVRIAYVIILNFPELRLRMISHPNRRFRGFLVIIGPTICVMSFLPASAIAEALSPGALAAVEQNARALDPIVIEWTRERKTSLSEEGFFTIVKGPRWVKGDTTFLAPARGEFKYQDGNVYRYFREEVPLLDFAVKVDARAAAPEPGKMPPLKCVGTREMETEVAF
ncbi:MAG: hypothetical protein ABSG53_20120, partial [Thermoguttaceae bacterium]